MLCLKHKISDRLSEPYYSELLVEPQAKLKGATVNELMTTWSIVSKTGYLLEDALSKKVFPKPEEANTWMPDFDEPPRGGSPTACRPPSMPRFPVDTHANKDRDHEPDRHTAHRRPGSRLRRAGQGH